MNVKSIHRKTGLLLTVFVLLHMITHLSGLFGLEAYFAMQNALRQIYRNIVIETLLLSAFAIQIVLGIRLITTNFRRKLGEKWSRRQTLSGLVLLVFVSQHLIAMSVTRWVYALDTTFYWPAAVMSGPPFYWYFAPYYFLGVSAIFVHLACAVRLHLLRRKCHAAAGPAFWSITVCGVLIAVVINLILLGAFFDIALPDQWLGYLQKFIPSYGG